jgi:Cu+-exporting ATPase
LKQQACYHCGDALPLRPIKIDQQLFCCNGCATVYQLLEKNELGAFYQYEPMAGSKPGKERADQYAFLDLPEIRKRYITFENEQQVRVRLSLPAIHCSSCIYLLENLSKLETKVLRVQVHFARKEAAIVFDPSLHLSDLALLLNYIGYPPDFSKNESNKSKQDRTFLFQLGIAGFAFGSIMLWSTPDYFGLGKDNPQFRNFSAYLSFVVSIPVLLFSARAYFISAFKAIRSKNINLDVPITIGIIALYTQSVLQIFKGEGAGYMDSFAGFIFFLLIGKWFQNLTYASLSFDRDFSSFFPVAIQRVKPDNSKEIIPVEALQTNDIIEVRNEEIVPCDSELLSDETFIDYSFVTGEALPVLLQKGAQIYAGGQIQGAACRMRVLATTDRSHLTQLWNETKDKTPKNELIRYQDRLSRYFLFILLLIAASSAVSWYFIDPSSIFRVVVAVLIVACPCALALSAPFTLGNTLRSLGKTGLYLKNSSVVEALTTIDTLVFDKTGTLTDPNSYEIIEQQNELSAEEFAVFVNLARQSTHPLSVAFSKLYEDIPEIKLDALTEEKGKGLSATFRDQTFRLGSAAFVGAAHLAKGSELFFSVEGRMAHFTFLSAWRSAAITSVLNEFGAAHCYVLSGDHSQDKAALLALGFFETHLFFEQTPQQKAAQIEMLQQKGRQVIYIGDGINDVGALGKANVGIALSEDMFRFTPSADAILEARYLLKIPQMLALGRYAKRVLLICLTFSLSYNIFGLSVAISGNLTPLFAAILMPISSITIVLLSTGLIYWKSKRLFKN